MTKVQHFFHLLKETIFFLTSIFYLVNMFTIRDLLRFHSLASPQRNFSRRKKIIRGNFSPSLATAVFIRFSSYDFQ